MSELAVTYLGGPTVVLEYGGLRILADPTFDPLAVTRIPRAGRTS